VHFSPDWYIVPKKSGSPAANFLSVLQQNSIRELYFSSRREKKNFDFIDTLAVVKILLRSFTTLQGCQIFVGTIYQNVKKI
jgi:hypothetical protein